MRYSNSLPVPKDYTIKPNYWDFIMKKTISVTFATSKISIDCYYVPLWLGNAMELTLELSNRVLYKAGECLHYGIYTNNKVEVPLISRELEDRYRPMQQIINTKLLEQVLSKSPASGGSRNG